jgi:hypothetical protein
MDLIKIMLGIGVIISLLLAIIAFSSVSVLRYEIKSEMNEISDQSNQVMSQINTISEEYTTNEKVLTMLKTYSGGGCGFVRTPDKEKWDKYNNPEDYKKEVLPYIKADTGGDGVTTGIEFCKSLSQDAECLYSLTSVPVQINEFGNSYVLSEPKGCAGGPSHSSFELEEYNDRTHYYCCVP